MRYWTALVIGFACIACGCQSVSGPTSRWIGDGGGIAATKYQERAQDVARPLISLCVGHAVTIQALNSSAPAAFSWRNGAVFVTRGLMDKLNDQQLSAAIAHELGHLLIDGRVHSVYALTGNAGNLDEEARADAYGSDLLRARGISPEIMIQMLQIVRASGSLEHATDAAVAARIAILRGRNEAAIAQSN